MAAISDLVNRTLRESPEFQSLRRLPMGQQASNAMESSLSGVAQRMVDELLLGIHSDEFKKLVERTAGNGFDTWLTVDEGSNRITEQMLYDILEMLKEQVNRQRWKDRYD